MDDVLKSGIHAAQQILSRATSRNDGTFDEDSDVWKTFKRRHAAFTRLLEHAGELERKASLRFTQSTAMGGTQDGLDICKAIRDGALNGSPILEGYVISAVQEGIATQKQGPWMNLRGRDQALNETQKERKALPHKSKGRG